jgi:hypothetical protein
MARHLRFVLSLSFALGLLLAGTAPAAAGGPALGDVDGAVEIGSGTPPVWRAAKSGDPVALGDAVRTGAGGRAELVLGDGRAVRVYEHSLLRVGTEVTPTGAVRAVELDEGQSLFEVMRKTVEDIFEVRTPEIIVSVKGTRFLVAAVPGPDYTSVFRGVVGLAGSSFDEVSVRAGFTGANGEVMVHDLADPWDAWGAGAPSPTPAVDSWLALEVESAIEEVRKEGAVPAAPAGVPTKVDAPDPVVDVARKAAQETGTTTGGLLEAVVGGDPSGFPGGGSAPPPGGYPGGPGGTSTPFPFTFDVVTSGGPNTVTIGFGAETVTLDQNGVNALVSGNTAPLGTFNNVVNGLGVDPQQLGQYLDTLI